MLFENYLRLTPDLPDRRGWMWGDEAVELERWEAIFALKISGKGRIHGDGMAFWWTKNPKVFFFFSCFSLLTYVFFFFFFFFTSSLLF